MNETGNSRNIRAETVPSYTYFIRVEDRIKIGFSERPARRLNTLRSGSHRPMEVMAVVLSTVISEADAHARFAHLREHGEWFRAEPELLSFIHSLPRHQEPGREQPMPKELPQPKVLSDQERFSRLRRAHKGNEAVTNRTSIIIGGYNQLRVPIDPVQAARIRLNMARAARELRQIMADGWKYIPQNHTRMAG